MPNLALISKAEERAVFLHKIAVFLQWATVYINEGEIWHGRTYHRFMVVCYQLMGGWI